MESAMPPTRTSGIPRRWMIGIGISKAARPIETRRTRPLRASRCAGVNSVKTPSCCVAATPGASRLTITRRSGIDHFSVHRGSPEKNRGSRHPERDIAEHLHAEPREFHVLVGSEVHPDAGRLFIKLVHRPIGKHH